MPEAYVHHTVNNVTSQADEEATLRSIQRAHMRPRWLGGRGWSDIAYNWLIGQATGTIYEGRGWGRVGGATGSPYDARSVSFALLGDGRRGLSDDVVDAFVEVIGRGVFLDALRSPVRIRGHRDVYPTACPGDVLYGELDSIRAGLKPDPLPEVYPDMLIVRFGGNDAITDGIFKNELDDGSVWYDLLPEPVPIGREAWNALIPKDRIPLT